MRAEHDHISLTDTLASTRANDGRSLLELSRTDATHAGLLLVFLRHSGCTFCREALADLSKKRDDLKSRRVRLVLVHMGPENSETAAHFAKYGLQGMQRVSDPDRALYRAFELERGTFSQLFGLKCVLRGAWAATVGRHWVGKLVGDGFQMPGVFMIRDGVVTQAFRHRSAADRPEYCEIALAGAR
ncbi:MAG: AhpC/TSA family protein [Phycisphaeraceae bacterium]|nr:AhpC/TSA family protein [Phycisphaeraceae bacterium]